MRFQRPDTSQHVPVSDFPLTRLNRRTPRGYGLVVALFTRSLESHEAWPKKSILRGGLILAEIGILPPRHDQSAWDPTHRELDL